MWPDLAKWDGSRVLGYWSYYQILNLHKITFKMRCHTTSRLNSSEDVAQAKSGNINLKIVLFWENGVQRWKKFFLYFLPLIQFLLWECHREGFFLNRHIWTNDQYSRPTSFKKGQLADGGNPKYTVRHGLGWAFIWVLPQGHSKVKSADYAWLVPLRWYLGGCGASSQTLWGFL